MSGFRHVGTELVIPVTPTFHEQMLVFWDRMDRRDRFIGYVVYTVIAVATLAIVTLR